ncbi:carbonic anhydrase [Desulfopila sp. IMCC35008]|uniref:carbonic anhydrase n=1 Tax=Desulfopila sp. IMCC35008 TaxID=2653858 RepID=UPI0013D88EB7|nr:carbonic anhydrase family protein [Desulfopila sp. IMCC35008]
MKRTVIAVTFAFTCGLVSNNVMASGSIHWGYSGEGGPENWGKLAQEFALCSAGKNQSPVDIADMINGNLADLAFAYQASGTEVHNNGHAIQVNYQPGSTLTAGGSIFELKQFHFHSPSENTIAGKSFPLEAHFVHADTNGDLAVVAVMYEEGEQNAELDKAWTQMPTEAGQKAALKETVDANKLLPEDKDYYYFNGSLTTPPCTEGVRWFVLKTSGSVSKEQVEKFAHVMHHPNNRPVQPLNARLINE